MTSDTPTAGKMTEEIETVSDDLSRFCEAYPLDIFPEPTKEQMTWLHETKPGLCDRIGAAMGRHCAKTFAWPALVLIRRLTADRDRLKAELDTARGALAEAEKERDQWESAATKYLRWSEDWRAQFNALAAASNPHPQKESGE